MRVRMMTYIEDDDEPTVPGLSKYSASEEPTLELALDRSDAIYEAHERLRLGNTEAAGEWLLVASGLEDS